MAIPQHGRECVFLAGGVEAAVRRGARAAGDVDAHASIGYETKQRAGAGKLYDCLPFLIII